MGPGVAIQEMWEEATEVQEHHHPWISMVFGHSPLFSLRPVVWCQFPLESVDIVGEIGMDPDEPIDLLEISVSDHAFDQQLDIDVSLPAEHLHQDLPVRDTLQNHHPEQVLLQFQGLEIVLGQVFSLGEFRFSPLRLHFPTIKYRAVAYI